MRRDFYADGHYRQKKNNAAEEKNLVYTIIDIVILYWIV